MNSGLCRVSWQSPKSILFSVSIFQADISLILTPLPRSPKLVLLEQAPTVVLCDTVCLLVQREPYLMGDRVKLVMKTCG